MRIPVFPVYFVSADQQNCIFGWFTFIGSIITFYPNTRGTQWQQVQPLFSLFVAAASWAIEEKCKLINVDISETDFFHKAIQLHHDNQSIEELSHHVHLLFTGNTITPKQFECVLASIWWLQNSQRDREWLASQMFKNQVTPKFALTIPYIPKDIAPKMPKFIAEYTDFWNKNNSTIATLMAEARQQAETNALPRNDFSCPDGVGNKEYDIILSEIQSAFLMSFLASTIEKILRHVGVSENQAKNMISVAMSAIGLAYSCCWFNVGLTLLMLALSFKSKVSSQLLQIAFLAFSLASNANFIFIASRFAGSAIGGIAAHFVTNTIHRLFSPYTACHTRIYLD